MDKALTIAIAMILVFIGMCIFSMARKTDKSDVTLEAVISTYLVGLLVAILSV